MHGHENNCATTEDRSVGTTYKFQIPLAPACDITIAESQRTVLAPTYLLAPGATPGGWTQMSRLAHDFLAGRYGVTGKAVWR
jgi:hypothetical protein